jgi:glycosyltransferase involved in cell wall biosynthesis
MRILMLTSVMYPVGTWYRVHNLALALGRRGHTVSIVRGGMQRIMPRVDVDRGVTIWLMPRLWGSSVFYYGTRMPWDIAARIAIQAPGKFDVVHGFTHHLNALLPTVVARLVHGGSLVVGDRDDLWSEGGLDGDAKEQSFVHRANLGFLAWTEREMGRWIGTMTVVSEDLRRRVVARGVDESRVRKIINGCPVDRITPGDQQVSRRALGLPPDRSIALFVGVGQYDVDLILDALVIFVRQNPGSEPPLIVLVGPHRDRLLKMAEARGLGSHVTATGSLSEQEIVPYLRSADVGLLPFADKPLNWARFPIKIGDYLAAGLPVLTNDVGEMGRLVRETASGEVTAPDATSYAAGLAMMLHDRAKLSITRKRAREAAERHSWDSVGESLERFYLEMGARP